jgi:hypothetical protein
MNDTAPVVFFKKKSLPLSELLHERPWRLKCSPHRRAPPRWSPSFPPPPPTAMQIQSPFQPLHRLPQAVSPKSILMSRSGSSKFVVGSLMFTVVLTSGCRRRRRSRSPPHRLHNLVVALLLETLVARRCRGWLSS